LIIPKTVKPKDKKELQQIVEDVIKNEGNECDLNFIDTFEITDMCYLFSRLSEFNGDISIWGASKVQNMVSMFAYSSLLTVVCLQ
jgi:hypothetical protein